MSEVATTTMIDMVARRTTGSRRIAAPPEVIFDLLANPSRHADFDGSGMVKNSTKTTSQRLRLGSKFQMSMNLKALPYRMSSTVVEFDENRLIAWRHVGKHRWRYELEPVDGGTLVTETFDWSTSLAPKGIEAVGWPTRHLQNIDKTLERLSTVAEHAHRHGESAQPSPS